MTNTSLIYIEQNSSYLMLHRTKKQNDYNHDKWIGIGGKFENTESPEECIIREVKEETGLNLQGTLEKGKLEYRGIVTFVCDDKNAPDGLYTEFMHLFWTDDFEGQLIKFENCTEGVLEWVPKNQMNDLPHWKGDEIFLKLIEEKSPFFSLKLVYKDGELLSACLNGKKIDA